MHLVDEVEVNLCTSPSLSIARLKIAEPSTSSCASGREGKTPAPKVELSYPLIVDCPNCGKACGYSDAEERFR
jgi:hypothetical protein